MRTFGVALLCSLLLAACGGSTPTGQSTESTPVAPAAKPAAQASARRAAAYSLFTKAEIEALPGAGHPTADSRISCAELERGCRAPRPVGPLGDVVNAIANGPQRHGGASARPWPVARSGHSGASPSRLGRGAPTRADRPDFTCFQAGSELAAITRGVARGYEPTTGLVSVPTPSYVQTERSPGLK
jgi:hypothetical protein